MAEIFNGISLVVSKPIPKADFDAGDKVDGFRMNFKINRGRRWKQLQLPVAVLRLERRGTK